MSSVLSVSSWESKTLRCRQITQDSLNPKWLLPLDQLPPSGQKNVSIFIETAKALSPREIEITSKTATGLLADMAAGTLTATETITAFLKRGHIAHQLTNFATEFLTEDALNAARELDTHFAATGKLIGPLHGLPISAKEHIGFKGRISHSGYVAWADNVAQEDALIVTLARNAGAIFVVRTNLPQIAMHIDCSNPINGTTVNPHNRGLTCGGSSGGEGAAVALRASIIGLGTDLGGSVRVPAAFCGTNGLRITSLRNPYKGICLPGLGHESIRCVVTPLANDIADIAYFQQALLQQEPWEYETSLVPMLWKKVNNPAPEGMTIGVMWDDGMVHPHPPVTRALKDAVAKLRASGCKIMDWEPYQHELSLEINGGLNFPDGAATQRDLLALGGEPVADLSENTLKGATPQPMSYSELWDCHVRRDEYRDAYHRVMRERGVDFILCPVYVGAAAVCGQGQYYHYTAVWNVLDQPAIAFQTGLKVDPQVDIIESDYKPRSAVDEREYKKYDPITYAEAPIALQLVGKRYRDEEVVAAAETVSRIVRG
ncbi:hypothetical protein BHE90_016170 [Fusarium euwallaceae]|uniref:amidase n=1 Tax=Fusarium euwallaceae TaxID=1147111 RepID=A0A430L175_9HYPO|nr:hypothetical protein BHE90_016170 [Fusarium euwallaceae]